MQKAMIAAAAASLVALSGCTDYYGGGPSAGYAPAPAPGYWDATQYYRDDPRYQSRPLGRNDTVYRGSDGRYYCKRSDGTTGLIIGGIAGGVLGNIIAPGGSKTLGTILGAAGGAVLGQSVDKGQVQCR